MKIKTYHVLSKTTDKGYVPVSGNIILKKKRVVSPISTRNPFPNAIP